MSASAAASQLLTQLATWWLQASLLLVVGLLLPALCRLTLPTWRLRFLHGLLVAVLALPLAGTLISSEPRTAVGSWIVDGVVGGAGPTSGGSAALWVLLLVGGGAGLRLAWLLAGYWTLGRWRRTATLLDASPVLDELPPGLRERAELRVSQHAPGPLTFGMLRPIVLVPTSFLELPPAAQRLVLCHELVHVARRDWVAVAIEEVLRSLLWFQPLLLPLWSQLRLAREQVVDAEVVRLTGSRRGYLEALLAVARSSSVGFRPGLALLEPGHLRSRVALLAKEVSMTPQQALSRFLGSAGALALVATLSLALFPSPSLARPEASAPSQGELQLPKRLTGEAPQYPPGPREAKVEGKTELRVDISDAGRVVGVAVGTSSGNAELDQAALAAVAAWTFSPATVGGEPVPYKLALTLRWALE